MWACAQWMAKTGRAEANTIAGEDIPFRNEKSKVSEVEGMIPHNQKVVAPLFNIVSSPRVMFPPIPTHTRSTGGRLESLAG